MVVSSRSFKAWIFSIFLLLLLVASETDASSSDSCGEAASGYASTNPGCALSGNCTQLSCSGLAGGKDVQMTVYNCEDPVRVVLDLQGSGQHCNRTYLVSGYNSYDEISLGNMVLHASHSRNTSHLLFLAYMGSFPSGNIVPPVTIPLALDVCMYEDFEDAAQSFSLPSFLTYACAAETNVCGGFQCNFTGGGESYSTCVSVEPCNETLQVTIWDSGDNVQYDEIFNTNKTVNLTPSAGPNFSLRVHLHHYNYSMEVQLTVVIEGDIAAELLPHQRLILDRSECSPLITYPAAPPTVDPSPMLCSAPSSAGPHPVTMATPTSLPTFPSPGGCGNLQASYASAHAGCSLASDCLMAKCSLPDNSNAMLVVFNCEDPVRVVLSVSQSAGQCSRTYSVSGSETTVQDDLLGSLHITSIYSRNASHVQFMVSSGKGSFAIPPVTLPLLPGKCMFGDFVNTSKNVVLPSSIVYSCKAETKMCGGILCNFTVPYQVGISEVYETCITIDPCQESIQIVIRDSLDNSVFDELFNQTRSIFIQPQQAQPFTLRVILVHYNYSMEAKVTVNVQLQNFPFPVKDLVILPRQRFILDRTKCVPFISFPAAPDKWSTLMDCHPYATTPKASGSHSHIAVAILVPVALVLVAIVTAITLVTVFLVHRWRKKRADVGFQRITFNDVDFEDSEDDEN